MQTFSFAPPNLGLGDNKKNYVFVDEHNRHKRLKVMRACEGCRRRKIKCDAATTNAWPCAACVRLKLHCVPPTVNYDRNHATSGNLTGLERVLDFDNSSGSGEDEYGQHMNAPQVFELGNPQAQMHVPQTPYNDALGVFHTPPYSDRALSQHEFSTYEEVPTLPAPFLDHTPYQISTAPSMPATSGMPIWQHDEQQPVVELSDVLGELKINENGIEAPYISQQKKSLAEAPALEEFEVKLPSTVTGSGSTVRIPPELMPSEEQCMEWFDIFFTHIHPYVPVISKPYFYQQWRTNRRSISPLILEAIFACAGRMSDDPAQGAQWLALASKHEDCFMDVPRLSTIQALLLLLKARESAPKRGYYYRSWMTVKTLVTLAKDLELHQHYGEHQQGRDCGSDPTECLIKTRIWQNIFICEMMIGGPQGRTDMDVDPETVDFSIERPSPSIEASDYQVSRQFTYLVRNVKNVRNMSDLVTRIKKQKDWASDPTFINLNPTVKKWLDDLPSDLRVSFPEGDAHPWLPSHFVGNMHAYYHLNIIMLHRPQLMAANFSAGGTWKQHMTLCYNSAKAMCRLQAAVLHTFGLSGLLCMQRGINFMIYSVLTCTMIHLVAITSPDPDFNGDAREYFTRHMRILEKCTSAWPMPETQTQIDALREAFSADTTKAFELRATFPYGSPGTALRTSPPVDLKYQHQTLSHESSREQPHTIQYTARPLTPPMTAGLEDNKDRTMAAHSLAMLPSGQQHQQQQQQPMRMASHPIGSDQSQWNPSRIFDQWNTAFGNTNNIITSTTTPMPEPSPPLYTASSVSSQDLPHLQDAMQQSSYQLSSSMAPISQLPPQSVSIPRTPSYTSAGPNFVTPGMWRDTVASTYDPGGSKRRWDMETSFLIDPMQNKRSR